MDVVALGVEDPAELAVGELLPAVHRRRVVVAGLAHHVGEPGLLDQLDDARDLVRLDRHRHRRVDVLAGLERLDRHLAVQPPLGEDRDRVDVGLEHLLERRVGHRDPLLGGHLRRPLRDDVGQPHIGHVRMRGPQPQERRSELAGSDHTDADSHAEEPITHLCSTEEHIQTLEPVTPTTPPAHFEHPPTVSGPAKRLVGAQSRVDRWCARGLGVGEEVGVVGGDAVDGEATALGRGWVRRGRARRLRRGRRCGGRRLPPG